MLTRALTGMGVFDLTRAQLKCLTTMEWLNDEVLVEHIRACAC